MACGNGHHMTPNIYMYSTCVNGVPSTDSDFLFPYAIRHIGYIYINHWNFTKVSLV